MLNFLTSPGVYSLGVYGLRVYTFRIGIKELKTLNEGTSYYMMFESFVSLASLTGKVLEVCTHAPVTST